jgi:regulator of protease activity HflC (stomatin/prohibitin superfamily)
MFQEKDFHPVSGALMVVLCLILAGLALAAFLMKFIIAGVILTTLLTFLLPGFFINDPNESRVLILFGKYVGTARNNGFYWVNPFMMKKEVSLRARNFNGHPIKVNDKLGNPIEIATVLVWKVQNTAKAIFEVDDYRHYVDVQSEAAVRQLAGAYPYDHTLDEHDEITLRDSAGLVNEMLEKELHARLERAGIHVIEARISHLAYASEIAGAMLQRQQATAIVAARKQIVEGAVGMVEMALDRLREKEIVHLDEDRKAAMVSNLLVVLCSDKSTTPVVNTGTLHH